MKPILTSIRATLVLAAVTCGAYPLLVTGIAQTVFKKQAAGSLITDKDGKVIGSALLGLDEPADAAAQYTRALASATPGARPGIRLGLAECARAQGDDDRAAADYRALVADEATPEALKAIARERLAR